MSYYHHIIPVCLYILKIQEQSLDNKESPWVIEGQKIVSGAADGSFSVTTEIVEFSDLGMYLCMY